MNLLVKLTCLLILFSSEHALSKILAEYQEEKTKQTLAIHEAESNQENIALAKQFNKDFFRESYNAIPKEAREFETIDELVDLNFQLHTPFIRDNTYKFIMVKSQEKMVGYALFDISTDGHKVSFIECQADISTYSIKNLMPMMIDVIQRNYAPQVSQIYSMVRKAVPQFGMILQSTGYIPCDVLHQRITDPAEYYKNPELNNDQKFTRLKDMYHGYVYNFKPLIETN